MVEHGLNASVFDPWAAGPAILRSSAIQSPVIMSCPPAPGGKHMRKSANIRGQDGKMVKKEIFTVHRGKNIIFGHGGGGKISYFRQIFTPTIPGISPLCSDFKK